MSSIIVRSVNEYIEQIESIIGSKERLFVFRGEPEVYEKYCQPNIFRDPSNLNRPFFEKNLLDKIRSEGYDNEKSYLLTAIEAQHGGFKSRLLDISFNALVALFFAVTPFYKDPIDSKDDKTGKVIILSTPLIYSPLSKTVEDIYLDLILNEETNKLLPLYSHGHLFLDYYGKNKRVKAQQGGFILFCGQEFRPLTKNIQNILHIPGEYKEDIRNSLLKIFNISTATMYPEINNTTDRNAFITNFYNSNSPQDDKELLNNILGTKIKPEIDFHMNKIFKLVLTNDSYKTYEAVEKFEHMVLEFITDFYITSFYTGEYDPLEEFKNSLEDYLEEALEEIEYYLRANSHISVQISSFETLLDQTQIQDYRRRF